MARKTPKTRRTPVTSRPTAARVAAPAAAKPVTETPADLRTADLDTSYGYVAHDLRRIAVLAAIMFGIIFVSPLVLR
jgi:hypothetical protein